MQGIEWSTPTVLQATTRKCEQLGLTVDGSNLPLLSDIDTIQVYPLPFHLGQDSVSIETSSCAFSFAIFESWMLTLVPYFLFFNSNGGGWVRAHSEVLLVLSFTVLSQLPILHAGPRAMAGIQLWAPPA